MIIIDSGLKSLGDGDVSMIGRRVLAGLSSSGTHRNVPDGAAGGPVSLAGFAEMARLIHVVIVEVTEFGVHAFAARTWN